MGKMRSTPTPLAILRTVKVSVDPEPRRWMTTPWKAWRRSLLPSLILIVTVTVSPAPNSGHSWVSTNLAVMSLMRSRVLSYALSVRGLNKLASFFGVQYYEDSPGSPSKGTKKLLARFAALAFEQIRSAFLGSGQCLFLLPFVDGRMVPT